jgi:hypothetical protein
MAVALGAEVRVWVARTAVATAGVVVAIPVWVGGGEEVKEGVKITAWVRRASTVW